MYNLYRQVFVFIVPTLWLFKSKRHHFCSRNFSLVFSKLTVLEIKRKITNFGVLGLLLEQLFPLWRGSDVIFFLTLWLLCDVTDGGDADDRSNIWRTWWCGDGEVGLRPNAAITNQHRSWILNKSVQLFLFGSTRISKLWRIWKKMKYSFYISLNISVSQTMWSELLPSVPPIFLDLTFSTRLGR